MADRIPYFDFLRGIAIFGVIAIHSTGQSINYVPDNFNFHFTLFWRQILNFSVPLFLAISGYFIARKNITNTGEYFLFLKKQIPKIYIPCLFWSFIGFLLAVALGKPALTALFKMVTFQTVGAYYFIALIIQYYLLLPFLQKISTLTGLIVSAIVSISITALLLYIRYHAEINLPLMIYAGLFPTWMVFFVFGLYLGSGGKITISNNLLILGIIVSLFASALESYWLYDQFGQYGEAITTVKPTAFIYALFVIAFAFNNIGRINIRFFEYIGIISFSIYLIHMYILSIAAKILKIVKFPLDIQPGYQLGLILMTLVGCYIVIRGTQISLKGKFVKIFSF